jgi:MoaA/NifB/PqqE/SkfB family radical SAM enzyme
LDTDEIKKIIDAAAERGFQAISFTGGEPLLDVHRLVDLIKHAGKAGIPFIRTGTNGFLFAKQDKDKLDEQIKRIVNLLAETPLRNFWISIDSVVAEIHEKMRGFPGVVKGIEKALPVFHQAGLYPAVNLGINRNIDGAATSALRGSARKPDNGYLDRFYISYRRAFARFYQRAIDMGFTMANTCYPMSILPTDFEEGMRPVYAATATDNVVRFSPPEKAVLFRALQSAIRQYRSRIRIFTPLCSLEALIRQHENANGRGNDYGCRGGIDFFYVNAADGHTYPCGYRGNEDFGCLSGFDIDRLRPPSEENACRQCDWECFRDPSEMFGPLLKATSRPLELIRSLRRNPNKAAVWIEDFRYYQACHFFNGRKDINRQKLKPFSPSPKSRSLDKKGSHSRWIWEHPEFLRLAKNYLFLNHP